MPEEVEIIEHPDGTVEFVVHGELAERLLRFAAAENITPQQAFNKAMSTGLAAYQAEKN